MIMDDFLIRALIAGLLVAVAVGPLGAMVVWRRMAYFGDATAHAAVLGVSLALAFQVSIFVGTLLAALGMAALVAALAGRGWAVDTMLGVLAHSALALGLVAISFVPGVRVNLESFLFGDILTVQWVELWAIGLGAMLVAALLAWRWNALLLATISEDLALTRGVNPARERLILNLALAVTVAVALKAVGALLIAALLLIPAATARVFARSPEGMAALAVLMAALAVTGGLWASMTWDSPAGPSIVAVSAVGFVAALSVVSLWRRIPKSARD